MHYTFFVSKTALAHVTYLEWYTKPVHVPIRWYINHYLAASCCIVPALYPAKEVSRKRALFGSIKEARPV